MLIAELTRIPDVKITGSDMTIFVFVPNTDKARQWVDENAHVESWQWVSSGFAVEPSYARALAAHMLEDGLCVR